jgi:VCBS repeat-containing protein
MAQGEIYTIRLGQDLVIDGFTSGAVLRFEGSGLTSSNLMIDRVGADTVLSFVGSSTSLRLTNFSSSYFNNPNNFASTFQFSSVVSTNPTGSIGNDVVTGGNGNDVIRGGAGNDTISGGKGNDQLFGEAGNDKLDGGTGNDTLTGGTGSDWILGGDGNDTLIGSVDATWPGGWVALNVGDPGAPGTNERVTILDNVRSYDVFDGGAGTDTILLSSANDALFLDDPYSDTASEGARIRNVEIINAGDGNDVVDLTSTRFGYGDVTIDGGSGNDVLWGSAGNDSILGGTGNDNLFGGSGRDTLSGGDGNDTIDGGRGDDLLIGGAGDDLIFGGAGNEGATITVTNSFGGGGQSTWAGVNVTAQNIGANGQLGSGSASNVGYTNDGMGASGNQASRPSVKAETGYDPVSRVSETVSVALPGDVASANVSLAWFYSAQTSTDYNKSEQAFWRILNDGNVVAEGRVIATGTSGDFSFTIDPPGNAVFDTLVMWAGPYVTASGATAQGSITDDSSDFLVRAITTTAVVPDTAQMGGNDRIVGGAGNDRIDGGAGTDTSVYSSYITDYAFSRNSLGELVVTDARPGSADGTDTLVNVEFLEFLNGVVVPTGNLGYNAAPDAADGTAGGTEDHAIAGQLSATDTNGDALTFALAQNGGPAHGTVTINPNGSYTYTPAADYNGTDSFTYTVSDGKGGTDTATVTLNVAPVNDAPLTAGGAAAGTEDSNVTGRLTATDVDGDALNFALAPNGQPANGVVTINPDGTYSYVPHANFNGTDSFTYRVSDGNGGVTTGTVSVNVSPVNDAPTTSNATYGIQEDGSIGGRVQASDVDGDTLTFGLTPNGSPAHGTVTFNPDGTFNYVPATNYNGSDAFTYTVSDGKGGTTTGTVTINVAAANDAPTTSGGTATGNEDTAITGQLAASDVDGDALTFGLAQNGAPAHGTVTVNPNGSYTYTPAANFNGTDSFTYQVSDGKGGTTLGTITVGVNPVNDAPTTSSATVAGQEDGSITGRVTGNDVDGDTLTFALDGAPANGAVTFNPDGTFSYVPAPNFNGTDSFTYSVSDGQGGTTTGTVSVNVAAVNDGPTTSNSSVTGSEDTPITGQVVGADVDGDALTFGVAQGPEHGTLSFNPDGSYSYTPTADWAGTDSFTYTVSDGKGGTATGTVNLGVAAVADTPALSASFGAPQTTMGTSTISLTQLGGSAGYNNTYGYYTIGANGEPTGGTILWSNVKDHIGQTAVVSGLDPNTTGFFIIPNGSGLNGSKLQDGESVSFVKGSDGKWTAVDGDGNRLAGEGGANVVFDNPALNAGNRALLQDNGNTGDQNWEDIAQGGDADFNDVNVVSSWTSDNNGHSTIPLNIVAASTDRDGSESLSVNVSGLPAGSVLRDASGNVIAAGSDGSYTLTPSQLPGLTVTTPPGYTGPVNANVVATATDGASTAATSSATGTSVDVANDAPVANNATASGTEDNRVTGNLTGSDADGDRLTFSLAQNGAPAHGSVTINPDGTYSYTPAANYNGADSFTFRVTDGRGGVTTGTVSINLAAVNDAPTTANSTKSGNEDSQVSGRVTATDVDGDALTFTVPQSGAPAHGTVTMNPDGTYTYTPAANYNGTDSFTYQVSDGKGGTTTGTVTFAIAAVNDAPTTSGATFAGQEDGTVAGRVTGHDVDGDALTFGLAPNGGPAHGTVTFNPDGTFVYTPAANYNGTDSFTYTVSDGKGGTVTGTATVDVAAVNDGPTTAGATVAGNEDNTITGRVVAQDADGDALNFAVGDAPQHGAVTMNPDGTFSYTPAPNFNGTDSFTYTVSDGNGGTTTGTVTLSVAAVNDAPVTSGGEATIAEDGSVTGQLVASDVDGDAITFGLAQNGAPTNGTVTVNPDGSYSYTPNPNFAGTDSFTYQVSDGNGGTTLGTITVTVTNTNDAPTTSGATVAGQEDGTITGQVTGHDVDGDALSFAVDGAPANGTVTMNPDGSFSYTPAANFNGTDSFTYTVSDGNGGTTTGTVSVNVAAVNDAPTTSGGTASGTEDGSVTGQLAATDVDGDALTFGLAQNGAPANGTVTVNPDGSYTYTPAANFNGTDSFTYTVSDGNGGVATGSISVTVDPTNDAPTTSGASLAGQEDGTIAGQVTGHDVDGDALTFAVAGAPANGTVTMNPDGSFSYTPATNFNGTDSFTYTVADGNGGTTTGTVSVNVAAVNDAPTTAGGTADVTEDGSVSGQLAATDVDGDALTFGLAPNGAPTNGTVTVNPDGSYTYTPAANFNGTDSFTYTVSDGQGGVTTGSISVTVDPTNDAPTTSSATVAGQEDGTIAGQVTGHDADGDALSFAVDGAPSSGTVTMNPDGSFSYTPAANFNGTDSFTYTVSDGNGGTTTGTVSVNVAAVNDAPIASNSAVPGVEDNAVIGQISAADVDGDALTFGLAPNGAPTNGTVTVNPDGSYTYTPAANFNGTDSFTYTVSDGQGGTTTGSISVTVDPANDAPTTSGATLTGQEDGTIAGQVTGHDVDGDALTFTVDGAPANGTVTMNPDGSFSYTPAANFNGTDSFTYTVSDGNGGTTTGTVSVNVAAVNDAPTTSGGAANVAEDGSVTGQLSGTDVDGDTIMFGLAENGGPAHGAVTINPDGSYSYTPNPDFVGTDSFTYSVSDGNGGTTLGTISVTVTNTNDAPTTSSATVAGQEDGTIAGQVIGHDADGDALTFAVDGAPANGTVTMNPDGSFSYTPAANFNGTDSFTYTVSDGNGGTTTGTVSVNVAAVNDAPTTSGGTASGTEDGSVTGQLAATDVDGDALTFGLAQNGGPAHGTVTVNPNGSYTYTPAANFNGTDSFTYTVSDGNGGVTTGSISVTVDPANDAPTTSGATLTGQEDGTIAGQVTGHDVDGDALTFALDGAPANGTVTFNPDGTFTYTPAPSFNGTDSFTYQVSDGNGGTTTGTVSVNVAAVNDAPVAANATASGTEDNVVTGQLTATDVDGDTLTFALADNGGPAHGNVTVNPDGSYTYTPNADWAGTDSFTYQVSDGNGGTTTATVSVNVAAVADVPNVDIGFGTPSVNDGTSGVTVTNHGGSAGYNNSYGYYVLNDSGQPVSGGIIWANTNATVGQTATVAGLDADRVGFFVIPNGSNNNPGEIQNGEPITFSKGADGKWIATDAQGNTLTGNGANVLFDKPVLNAGGFVQVVDNGNPGNQNWEDLAGGGDNDFNDVNATTVWTAENNSTSTYPLNVSASPSDRDGSETITGVTLTGIPAGSVLKDANGNTIAPNGDGSYSLTPAQLGTLSLTTPPGFSGTLDVTATATAKDGTSTTTGSDSASVNVAEINLDPVTAGGVVNGTEDGVTTGQLVAQDPNGDPLTFGLAQNGGPAHGTVSIAPDGSYTYTPAANYNGTDAFTYTVSDGKGGTATGTIVVNVAAVNDAPTTSGGTASGTEDGSVTGQLAAQDVDGDTVTFGLAQNGGPAHGTVTINPNGSYTYTPAANFNGNDSFTYTVSDGKGGTVTGSITVSVSATNDAPTTSGAIVSGNEDGTISGQVTGHDVDGDALTFGLASNGGPAHGAVTFNPDGTFVYTPAANYNGTDSFTYTVSDGKGGTVTGTVSVNVAAVNDAPTAANSTAQTDEDQPLFGRVAAHDVDGDALTFALAANGAPAHGTVTLNADGTYAYTPAANYHGTDSFTYSVSDGNGGTTTGTVTISVASVNDAPVAQPTTANGLEDAPAITGHVVASDVDGDALSFALASDGAPANGTVTLNPDGSFSYTPAANFNGSDSFAYEVSDGNGGVTRGVVNVMVAAVNDSPTAPTQTMLQGTEDIVMSGTLPASDVDGENLTFALVGAPPAGFTLNPDGTYQYTPAANANGPVAYFDYTVTDPSGVSVQSRVYISLTPVNDAPWFNDKSITIAEGSGSAGVLQYGDVDGDTVTVAIADGGAPQNGTVVLGANGTYTYVPNPNFSGNDSFQVAVTDANGATTIGTVAFTVTPVNDAPITTPMIATGQEDNAISGQLSATDPDGDAITYYLPFGYDATNGQLTFNPDGSFTFVPKADWNGQVEIYYHARDAWGAETSGSLKIVVDPVNDAPIALTASASGAEDTTLAGRLTASDVDGDALTFALAPGGAPAHGTLTIQPDGSYTYVPAANFNGTDSFTYQVSDGNGGTVTKTVALDIAAVNDTPVTQGQDLNGTEDHTIAGQLAATDADGDALSYSLAANGAPQHGSVTLNLDGSFTYAPAANYNGTDSFTYQVSDGKGGFATATVTLNVAGVNDAPVAGTTALSVNEDTVLAGRLVATDAEGDTLTFALASGQGPAHGTLDLQPDGTYLYTPAANYHGTDTFTYTVSDGNGGSLTQTVTIAVASVNDAPVPQNATVSGTEDTAITGQVTATDIEGDNLTFSVPASGRPAHGTVTMAADGSYSYVPHANYNGTDSFTYRVSDGNGGITTATVTINLAAVNDAPVANAAPIAGIEDTVVTGRVVATDVDGDALSYTLVSAPAHGALTFASDGSYTFAPSANYNGNDTFVYQVSDGHGGVTNVVQTIQVAAVNDAPTTVGFDAVSLNSAPVAGTLTAQDIDGDALTFGLAANGGPSHGTVSIAPDGRFVYTPATGYDGADAFTYVVSDGKGGTATATVSLTLVGDNDAPEATNTAFALDEDTVLNGNLGIVDPEGHAFTYALADGPDHGTLMLGPNGTFVYTPAENYHGGDSFQITLSDVFGATQTQTISLAVASVIDVPRLDPIHITIDEDSGPITFPVSVVNPDGLAFGVSSGTWSSPLGSYAWSNDGQSLTFTPNADANGTANLSLILWDGNGVGTQVPVVIDILPVDDGPRVDQLNFGMLEDTTIAGRIDARDPDGGGIAGFALVEGPDVGEFTLNADGTFTFTPPQDYFGNVSFTYVVTDTTGASSTLTSTIAVANVGDPPVTWPQSFSGTEDSLITGKLEGYDPDGGVMGTDYWWVDAPGENAYLAEGYLDIGLDGTFTFRPDPDWYGTATVHMRLADKEGFVSEPVLLTFTITPVNDLPTGANYTHISIAEDTTYSGNLGVNPETGAALVNDVETARQDLAFTVARQAAHGTVTLDANGDFVYTPNANYHGWDNFSYTVTDADGGTVTLEAPSIYVSSVIDPMIWTDGLTVEGSHTLSGYVGGSADGTAYTQDSWASHGMLSFNPDGTFVYTPNDGFTGTDRFLVTAYFNAQSEQRWVEITVTPNDAPVIESPNHETALLSQGPITGQILASDAEDDALTFSLVSGPADGLLTLNPDGSFNYQPSGSAVGPQSFVYQVDDGFGGVTQATHTIDLFGEADHSAGPGVLSGNWNLQDYVHDNVVVTATNEAPGDAPDTVVGFQAAEDTIDVTALFGADVPADWAAMLTAQYDAGAGGTYIGVTSEGASTPEWGVLLVGVQTSIDDLLSQHAITAQQSSTP